MSDPYATFDDYGSRTFDMSNTFDKLCCCGSQTVTLTPTREIVMESKNCCGCCSSNYLKRCRYEQLMGVGHAGMCGFKSLLVRGPSSHPMWHGERYIPGCGGCGAQPEMYELEVELKKRMMASLPPLSEGEKAAELSDPKEIDVAGCCQKFCQCQCMTVAFEPQHLVFHDRECLCWTSTLAIPYARTDVDTEKICGWWAVRADHFSTVPENQPAYLKWTCSKQTTDETLHALAARVYAGRAALENASAPEQQKMGVEPVERSARALPC